MEPHSHDSHPDLSNQIEIPSSIINSNLIRGTSGSNPWVDGIFYEAQWGNSIEVALNQQIPVYSFYFLKSEDSNLFAGSEQLRSMYQNWEGVKGKRGLAPFPAALQEQFIDAYKTISDVSKLELKEAKDPKDANVWIANAYYTNKGIGPNGRLLGSHQGLIDHNTGKKSAIPLIQDLNAFVSGKDIKKGRLGAGSGLFATLIHEAGHGIGLSHPHDSGLGGSMSGVYPGLVSGDAFGRFGTGLWGLTQTPYTIMSYKRGYTNQFIDQNSQIYKDNASTPMALDVAAIQMKYGVNRQTRIGDTTYELNPEEWTCIYDAGGNDWVSARAGSQRQKKPLDASINLRPAEMNAIRPDSGQPMEKYEWTDNANFDLALNTLISMRTSMIGAPLGMSVVLAGKIDRVLSDKRAGREFRKKHDSSLNDLGKTLKNLQEDQMIEPLQIVTSMRQYFDNYSFDNLKKFTPAQLAFLSPDFANIPERVLEKLILLLQESYALVDTVDQLFPQTFTEDSGPESMAVYLADLQDQQQDILARSGAGIAGYPMFFQGFNGGLTIAAGVIIENAEGGLGDDIIVGNAEDNQLVGGKGDDVLEGYFGADTLIGGPGSDVYAYSNVEDSPSPKAMRDEIVDFQAKDKISLKPLRESINSKIYPLTPSLKDEFDFQLVDKLSMQPGDVMFKQGVLSIDLDGNAVADMKINLPGVLSFDPGNLIV